MFYFILFQDALLLISSVEAKRREEEVETSFVINAKLVGDFHVLTESTDCALQKMLSCERERRRTNGNTTIINNFDFHLKIKRKWRRRNCFFVSGEKSFAASEQRKCVINENKIIDKKRNKEKSFAHSFVCSGVCGENFIH